jgi:hypothetical protein
MSEKVSAILALNPPSNVKELRQFLGMVQYYRDIWEKRSHFLAPLTDLVGECGHTKDTKKKNTKKKPWYWSEVHQKAFDEIKSVMARDDLLAYPDYTQPFEVYADASSLQLGAVIVQNGRPIAFFSQKLSETQKKYSVTEQELLSILECLKEFKGMLWGQKIIMYTDHKNLIQDSLGLTSDRIYRCRLLLEEYGPDIRYIKGIHNTVADALSRLKYNILKNVKDLSVHERYCCMAKCLSLYSAKHGGKSVSTNTLALRVENFHSANSPALNTCTHVLTTQDVFANTEGGKNDIYHPTVTEIAQAQKRDPKLKRPFQKRP